MSLTEGAIAKIEAMAVAAAGKTLEIDGKEYATTPLLDPRKPGPLPEALKFMGLQGIVDFCMAHSDLRLGGLVSVEGWEDVSVYGVLSSEWKSRPCYATCDIDDTFHDESRLGNVLNRYHPHEQFMIFVMGEFVPSPERERLLGFLGKVTQEKVQASEDDGVTQTVTLREGASMKAQYDVKNPFTLAPHRTFREIEQPESMFILRLRRGGEAGALQLALFESSSAKWKLEAAVMAKTWLAEQLPEWKVIG